MRRLGQVAVAVVAAVAISILAGCGRDMEPAITDNDQIDAGTVEVWRDDERGVTCWIFDAYRASGIDCIADSELGL